MRSSAPFFVALVLGCASTDGTSPIRAEDASTCTSSWPGEPGPGGDPHCSPAEEGRVWCSGGSGSGWQCYRGCWTRYHDGVCAPPWWGPDSGVEPACGSVGGVGGACRGAVGGVGGTCPAGSDCEDERFADAVTRDPPTLETMRGIAPGEPDPDHPGFFRARAVPSPSETIPLGIAMGSFCTQQCDIGATIDACGTCASCSGAIGTLDLLGVPDVDDTLPFDAQTGWCRADCTFDPAARDWNCPVGHTCSAEEEVCVEGCRSDAECQVRIVPTWDGGRVSILDPLGGTCDPTTLRCRWPSTTTESVGDACVRDADCTADVGRCFGGACTELRCGDAADTDPSTYACDGGRGVCLRYALEGTWCVGGCTTSDDCLAGSACAPLPDGGPFPGYCVPTCDTVPSDPDGDAGSLTEADDMLVACRSDERCDMPEATVDVPDPDGHCGPPCTSDADCAAPTRCHLAPGATDGVCGEPQLAWF